MLSYSMAITWPACVRCRDFNNRGDISSILFLIVDNKFIFQCVELIIGFVGACLQALVCGLKRG